MPQTCGAPDVYRSDVNGMAIATVQPPSNRPVRTFHTGFQSTFRLPSSVTAWSARAPSGLV